MKRSKFLTFGMLVAVIGVLSWYALERRGEPPAPAASHVTIAQVDVESATSSELADGQKSKQAQPTVEPKPAADPKASSTPSTSSELPDFNAPPDQVIARLRVLAADGNIDAKIRLSGFLASCTARAIRASRQSSEFLRKSIEDDRADQTIDAQRRAMRIVSTQSRIDGFATFQAACEALPADVLEGWLDPSDHAAQSGNIEAMRQYASLVVAEYDTRNAVMADVDQAILRRDKARVYLNRAASLGEAEALADLAYAYLDIQDSHPQLYAVDNYKAYLYAYAASLGEAGKYRQLPWVMKHSAESLNSNQISDARKQGDRMFGTCCRKH